MALLPDVLTTGPVELRRVGPDRIDSVMSAIAVSQAELAPWLPWADPMPSREEELSFLVEAAAAFAADREYSYALIEPGSAAVAGTIGLHSKEPGVAEIGYWVRTDLTRRGYASGSARALTEAAFEFLPSVDKVIIRMDRANLASASVPPKIGFHLESTYEDRDVVTSGHTGVGLIWARRRA